MPAARRRAGLGTFDPLNSSRLPSVFAAPEPADQAVPQAQDAPEAAEATTSEPTAAGPLEQASPTPTPSRKRAPRAPRQQRDRVPGTTVVRNGPLSEVKGVHKEPYSSYYDPDLLEEVKDAYMFIEGRPGAPRRLSGLIEEAVRREIARLQDEHNQGRPFPIRAEDPRAGGNRRANS